MNATPVTPRLTDRKREAIIQAAIAEFRDNGFKVTSMDRIAARAEVSKRTVYRDVLAMVADREKYKKVVSGSFGLWMDYCSDKDGWDVEHPAMPGCSISAPACGAGC